MIHHTWIRVTQAHLDDLYESAETLRGQLALTLGVLLDMGFDPKDLSALLL